ncbi:MAG: hypothetical protein HFG54_15085 [Lachnospiraceae bacterium]|jgi:hypothetical protein|nr:hypothetical protein [Lachnospiraceae bacterium]
MSEFFDFTIWCAKQFTGFLFALPFADGFAFGHALVAVSILAVLIASLVGVLRVANLSPEAHAKRPPSKR